jgi:hypothetical protein
VPATEVVALGPGEPAPDGALAGLSDVECGLLRADHPFLHHGLWRAFLALHQGRPAARVVAGLDPRQRADDGPLGTVGFLAGADDPPAFAGALAAAHAWLRDRGAVAARAPVQLTTWFGHRAVITGFPETGGPPPFPLEPWGPRCLVRRLVAAGYAVAHRAVSYRVRHDLVLARTDPARARLLAAGFRDRPLDPARAGDELALLHGLAARAFASTWGYSPISLAEFAALYRPLLPLVDPVFARVLEDPAGGAVGFAFALPVGEALLVKTLGVVPETRRRHPGLGIGLVGTLHYLARARGLTHGIHALMTEGAYTARTSARWGRPVRAYATFEQRL